MQLEAICQKNKEDNKTIANELKITEEFIYKRTGIKTRYYSEDETIEEASAIFKENGAKKIVELKKR